MKEFLQQNLYLLLFSVLISACGTGPDLNYCLPASPFYGCSSGKLPKENAIGFICTTSQDHQSIIRSCKIGSGMPQDLLVCIVNPGGETLACSDGQLKSAYGDKEFVCLSQRDTDELLSWCKRMKKRCTS